MVRVTINGTEYRIKTTWEECDIDKLLPCVTFREHLAVLSDVPRGTIDLLTDEQLFPFYTLTSFLDELENVQPIESVSVAMSSYEQLELAKRYLKEGRQYQKVIKAAQVYYEKEKNPSVLLGHGVNIVQQIANFLSNYEEMITSKPDADEESAGIEELSAFGATGTVFVLAGRDPLKVREIFSRPAIEIYTYLDYGFKEARYMNRLHEIRHPKKT